MEELNDRQYEDEKQAIKKRKLNYQRYNWFNSEMILMSIYTAILKNVIMFKFYLSI